MTKNPNQRTTYLSSTGQLVDVFLNTGFTSSNNNPIIDSCIIGILRCNLLAFKRDHGEFPTTYIIHRTAFFNKYNLKEEDLEPLAKFILDFTEGVTVVSLEGE